MYITKKENNSFNKSNFEEEAYKILIKEFKEVKRQYKDRRYPYRCDFYIPERDQFIEINITWTHGGTPFNKNNPAHKIKLDNWKEKSKTSKFFKNAINVWTISDVKKLGIAKKNNLNYTPIYWWFNDKDFLNQVYNKYNYKDRLAYQCDEKDLYRELKLLNSKKGDYNSGGNYNKIILSYQPQFYQKENELWQNENIRMKLINNRVKYLNKNFENITSNELLAGFKKSGIHYGYSHFNPLWIKAFIEEFKITSIYDPCGGWGHRLLGGWNINYIYNDADFYIAENVRELWRNLGKSGPSKHFHIKDAASFTPHQDYEAVFTCPPYYNIEKYNGEKDSVKMYPKYIDWLNIWWKNLVINSTNKENCKLFAFVVNSKLKNDMVSVCTKVGLKFLREQKVGKSKKSHLNKRDSKENLIIFKKNN
jgi:hypothetical protein